MRVALYCRVSTEEQGDNKTVERQFYELKNYCKERDYKIVKEYKDVISGTIMKRPQFDQMKQDAKDRMFEIVLVSELSRISRGNDAIVDVILLERELEVSGVKLYLLDGSSDNDIIKMVKAIEAKSERQRLISRCINGRLARAQRNSPLGGITKYGYTYFRKMVNGYRAGVWEINNEEAKTINLIVDLYTNLQSMNKVMRELNRRGVKQRNGNMRWSKGTFQHILNNHCYATGISHYKGIPFNVPKIVDQEKWERIQQIKKQRSNKHLKISKYLLGGLLRCNICGSTFSGELCKGVRYYRCNNRHRTFPDPRTCNAKMVLADVLENGIWNKVSYLMENPEVLQKRIDYLNRDNKNLEHLLEEEEDNLIKKISLINKKRNRFLDLFSEDTMNKEELLSRVGQLKEEEDALKQQLSGVENKLIQINKKPLMIKDLKEFCKLARVQMKLLTFEEKQEFLRIIIKEIKYDSRNNEAFINGYIPIKSDYDNSPVLRIEKKETALTLVGTKNPPF